MHLSPTFTKTCTLFYAKQQQLHPLDLHVYFLPGKFTRPYERLSHLLCLCGLMTGGLFTDGWHGFEVEADSGGHLTLIFLGFSDV